MTPLIYTRGKLRPRPKEKKEKQNPPPLISSSNRAQLCSSLARRNFGRQGNSFFFLSFFLSFLPSFIYFFLHNSNNLPLGEKKNNKSITRIISKY